VVVNWLQKADALTALPFIARRQLSELHLSGVLGAQVWVTVTVLVDGEVEEDVEVSTSVDVYKVIVTVEAGTVTVSVADISEIPLVGCSDAVGVGVTVTVASPVLTGGTIEK
jgi:hypothetical protein